MIQLTEAAIREVKRLQTKYEPSMVLRVGVKPSGCSGMSYTMNFEPAARDGDETLTVGDITVVVDPLSLTMIDEMVVDFTEDLLGGGFRFNNPIAVSNCGCGSSFSVAETQTAASA
ncbi:MAG: iron-sulfur cluster assembly accessory protein [Cyanobacteria bacterium J06642_2]